LTLVEQKNRSESLYFRASTKLKDDAAEYGEDRGLTLSSALAVLIERGLEASANDPSVERLEQRVQELVSKVAVLKEREKGWQAAFGSLQAQLRTLAVGRCPLCHQVVTASDQFMTRRCPWQKCGKPLQHVLPFEKAEDAVPPALAGLIGGLAGFLLGAAADKS
jgi:hypothetical protein